MPANNASGYIHYWSGKNPGCVGHIHSPSNRRSFYQWVPYALDNDRFLCYSQNKDWDQTAFLQHWEIARWRNPHPPLWGLVPDWVGDGDRTLEEWHQWAPRLRRYGFPLAIAAQNGMTPSDIPDDADVIFMGGTDDWKFSRLAEFVALGKPVHVGRINGNRLWQCYDAGVASCDGSGWFRGDQQQLAKLDHYLRWLAGEVQRPHANQMHLWEVAA